jgi:hypothetical protein
MSSAERVYSIAVDHAQTVQVCIDRLHELGANAQFKLLTGRLQKLAVRATPGKDDKGTKAARRQQGRLQNLKGQPAKGGKLIARAASDGAHARWR